jgi:hypothetical protein
MTMPAPTSAQLPATLDALARILAEIKRSLEDAQTSYDGDGRRPKAQGYAERDLDRVLTLVEAAKHLGVSPDTLKRRHRDKIVVLSPRRIGMRYRHVLEIAQGA